GILIATCASSHLTRSEQALDLDNPIDKRIDIAIIVIDREAGPRAGTKPQTAMQRVRTMAARTDRHTALVKFKREILRHNAIDHKRDHTAAHLWVSRAEHAYIRDLLEAAQRIRHQIALVVAHRLHADRRKVIDRRAQTDRLHECGRASLE